MVECCSRSSSLRRLARWCLVLVLLAVPALVVHHWLGATAPPDEHFERGLAAFRDGRLDELRACAAALAAFPGYEPHSQLLEGMVLMRRGQFQPALDRFWNARHHDDTRQLAFSLSGEAFYHLGNLREAIRILSVAVQADPDNIDAHRWAAAACYDIGAMDQAQRHLQRVAELAPDDPRPNRLRGLIHKDFERYDLAAAEYREALRRHPGPDHWDEVRIELADCLRREGQFAEALAVLEPCAATPDADALRAECELALERPEPAAQLVRRALDKDPQHRDALLVQADIVLQAGDAARAAEFLERAVEAHPRDDLVRYRLAQVYRRLGRDAQAEEQAAAMRELRELGKQFTKLHERAFNDVSDPQLRYEIGVMANQLGRPLLARGWFEAALTLDPGHQASRDALRELAKP
jgi:tetratricopeptide (TPR) repeat protein